MKNKLLNYKYYFFDCDGVILDSNKIKSDVFYDYALPFGEEIAKDFLNYHKDNGGISRFVKFEYFFKTILKKENYSRELDEALEYYKNETIKRMKTCSFIAGFERFLDSLSSESLKFVVSGGAESDLLEVFAARDLDEKFFKICGSPTDKFTHMEKNLLDVKDKASCVFLGDSRLDYEVAERFGLDFIFVYEKSEFKDWKGYLADKENVHILENFLGPVNE